MGTPSDLLDELARVYARVAVEELLARINDGVFEESRDNGSTPDTPAEPPTASEISK